MGVENGFYLGMGLEWVLEMGEKNGARGLRLAVTDWVSHFKPSPVDLLT
jgi:hypothetical protein